LAAGGQEGHVEIQGISLGLGISFSVFH